MHPSPTLHCSWDGYPQIVLMLPNPISGSVKKKGGWQNTITQLAAYSIINHLYTILGIYCLAAGSYAAYYLFREAEKSVEAMPKTVPRQLAAGKQQLKCCRSGAAERYTPVDFDQQSVMQHIFVNSSRHAAICLQSETCSFRE